MRLAATFLTAGVVLASVLAIALVGLPVSAHGGLLTATPTPPIPQSLQLRCAAQSPGVWLITDDIRYPVGAPVHVALCNRLDVPVATRLSDDPLAPLLHLEHWVADDGTWLPLFDIPALVEDNGDAQQSGGARYAQILPGAVVVFTLVPPPEPVIPGGPYVSPPVTPLQFNGSLSDLPTSIPGNDLTPTRIIPRDGRPFERQAATPTATLAAADALTHTVALLRVLESGYYRLWVDYRLPAASEFETYYSPVFVIGDASLDEAPLGEEY